MNVKNQNGGSQGDGNTKFTGDFRHNAPVRILLVDDSSLYRLLFRQILEGDRRFELVGTAINGKIALQKIDYLKPDFVILDQEMPVMDGLETLENVRLNFPDLSVIMFSSMTEEGAQITLTALARGALDFVTKPQVKNPEELEVYIREKLFTRIDELVRVKNLAGKSVLKKERKTSLSDTESEKNRTGPGIPLVSGKYEVCGIGISTGGPAALLELIAMLPPTISGSLLITQHMPAFFTEQLARSLSLRTELNVKEAADGDLVLPGSVYIAPGGKHMRVRRTDQGVVIAIGADEPEMGCRPSVNVLFRSIAEVYGKNGAGVIMTGMGSDGLEGMRAMAQKGAYLFAQNEKSSLVFGMPSGPIKEGLARDVLDIPDIARRIADLLN